MKTITSKGILFGVALLGALTVTTAVLPASAQPRYEAGQHHPGQGGRRYRQTFTGRVTDVHSRESFDIKVAGETYNVYAVSNTPRRLSVGDRVEVIGIREDHNDIRDASVTIIRNRNR